MSGFIQHSLFDFLENQAEIQVSEYDKGDSVDSNKQIDMYALAIDFIVSSLNGNIHMIVYWFMLITHSKLKKNMNYI